MTMPGYCVVWPEHYGNPYEIKFSSIGYPVSTYKYLFEPTNSVTDPILSDDGMSTQHRLVCGELGDPIDIAVRVDGTKHIPSLTPMDSGLYTFVLNTGMVKSFLNRHPNKNTPDNKSAPPQIFLREIYKKISNWLNSKKFFP